MRHEGPHGFGARIFSHSRDGSDTSALPLGVPVLTGRVTARRFRLLRPVVWFAHTGIRLFVLAYFLVALTVLGVRHLVLPKVPEYREDIAAYATRLLGERVTIGSVEAR